MSVGLNSWSWSAASLHGRGGVLPPGHDDRVPTGSRLSEFLSQLSSDPKGREKFGPCLDKLLALRDQHDSLLLAKELFNIGCELADRGMTEGAIIVFATLVGARHAVPLRQQDFAFQDILARAQEHINALQGNGNILPRVEHLAKQMPKEIFNLSGFSAMAAAMPTFRFTTAAAKAILGTGIGPWLAANTIGFLAESAMFTSVGRGVRELIDGRGDSCPPAGAARIAHPTWVQEWVYGMPMLLGLKTFGGLAGLAGQALLARGYGYTALQSFSLWGMHQVGMLNGIMFGNYVGEAGQAIPGRDFWMRLAEAGVTAVHFNAMNPMLGVVANPYEALRRDFAETTRRFNEATRLPNILTLGQQLATAEHPLAQGLHNLGEEAPLFDPNKLAISIERNRDSVGAVFLERRLAENLGENFKRRPNDPDIQKIIEHFSTTSFPRYFAYYRDVYYYLLARSKMSGLNVEIVRKATHVFRHVMAIDPLLHCSGTLYDYLVQVAFERALKDGEELAFNKFLSIVGEERSISALERFFQAQDWDADYQIENSRPTTSIYLEYLKRRFSKLPFDEKVREGIAHYVGMIEDPNQREITWGKFRNIVESKKGDPKWRGGFSGAVKRSLASPIPQLFLDRLFKILMTEGLPEKIYEISSPRPFDLEALFGKLDASLRAGERDFASVVPYINGSIYTGFVSDALLAKKIAYFYHHLRFVMNSGEKDYHRRNFQQRAVHLMGGKGYFNNNDIQEMLYHRSAGNLFEEARQALQDKEVRLVVVPFRRWDRFLKIHGYEGSSEEGLFLSSEKSPSGKPLIAIRGVDRRLNWQEKVNRAVFLAANAVHEFEHFFHDGEINASTPKGILLREMRASVEENIFLLQQGEISEYQVADELSPDGFGMYLRKIIDREYIQGQGATTSHELPSAVRHYHEREYGRALAPVSLETHLADKFQLDPTDPRLKKLLENFSRTTFPVNPENSKQRYLQLLMNSEVTDLGTVERVTEAFRYVMSMNPLRRVTGSFYDHLLQVALERTIKKGQAYIFDDLVQFLARPPSLKGLEDFFQKWGLHADFALRCPTSWEGKLDKVAPEWREVWKTLPLAPEIKATLGNFLATYASAQDAHAFNYPNNNYLLLKHQNTEQREPVSAVDIVRMLGKMFQDKENTPVYTRVIQGVTGRARDSKMPLLYLDRFFKILIFDDWEKVEEMRRGEDFDWNSFPDYFSRLRRENNFAEMVEEIDGSIYTGFISDRVLAEKLANYYFDVMELTSSGELERRQVSFRNLARELLERQSTPETHYGLRQGHPNYGIEEVIKMLLHDNSTPLAWQAGRAIKSGEVELKIVSIQQIVEWQKKLYPESHHQSVFRGMFLAPEKRELLGEEYQSQRPLIVIKELDPALSTEEKITQAVELAAVVVHEFEHYLHHHELDYQTENGKLRSEMRAMVEDQTYLIWNGEMGQWPRANRLSPFGFGVYLRSVVDRDQLKSKPQTSLTQ